jgi:hypothetical protein
MWRPAIRTIARVGFNPFRPGRRSTSDLVLVVVTIVVAMALVAWAAWPS